MALMARVAWPMSSGLLFSVSSTAWSEAATVTGATFTAGSRFFSGWAGTAGAGGVFEIGLAIVTATFGADSGFASFFSAGFFTFFAATIARSPSHTVSAMMAGFR
jgi:hypothetical protein